MRERKKYPMYILKNGGKIRKASLSEKLLYRLGYYRVPETKVVDKVGKDFVLMAN